MMSDVHLLFGCIPIRRLSVSANQSLTHEEIYQIQNIIIPSTCTCNVISTLTTSVIIESWRLKPKYHEFKQIIAQVFTACVPFYKNLISQLISIKGD